MKVSVKKLTLAALMLALCLLLPFLTGQIPQIGRMLCPLHLPVLLCGFICGPVWGLVVGFIAAPLRSALFGMPGMYDAAAMCFELAAYGLVSGLLYRALPRTKPSIYISLIAAMLLGRIVWGVARVLLSGADGSFTWALFMTGAFTNAIPGIILQLVLVPLLVMVLRRAKLTE